jgi:hypothetical protein
VLALPVLILVGIALGPAAFILVFGAGCALFVAALVWVDAHAGPH